MIKHEGISTQNIFFYLKRVLAIKSNLIQNHIIFCQKYVTQQNYVQMSCGHVEMSCFPKSLNEFTFIMLKINKYDFILIVSIIVHCIFAKSYTISFTF